MTLPGDFAARADSVRVTCYSHRLTHVTLAIRNYHHAGNTTMIHGAVAVVATIFDRLGRHEPAATIAGFVVSSPLAALPVMAEFGTAIAHLRNVLGEATYESLARDHR